MSDFGREFVRNLISVADPVPYFGERGVYRMIRDADFEEPLTSTLTAMARLNVYVGCGFLLCHNLRQYL